MTLDVLQSPHIALFQAVPRVWVALLTGYSDLEPYDGARASSKVMGSCTARRENLYRSMSL